MKRKVTVLLQTACLFLAALSLLAGFKNFSTFDFGRVKSFAHGWPFPSGNSSVAAPGKFRDHDAMNLRSEGNVKAADETNPASQGSDSPTPPASESSPVLKDGNATLLQIAPSYVKAIMTPEDTSFSRLNCPAPSGDRYNYLRNNYTNILDVRPKYFFALDLY